MAKVLLIEDDPALVDMLTTILSREGHSIDVCRDGASGLKMLMAGGHEVCVMDWQLPEMTGVEICTAARNHGSALPILMLTARASADDFEQGLDSGADDYLTKPFAPAELAARVKALLRRSPEINFGEIKCADLRLCLKSGSIYKKDQPLELMPAEHALLEFLMRNKGKTFSAERLADHVWKSDAEATYGAVATCIRRLRKKIDDHADKSIIKTIHGIGYMLEE